MKEEQNHIDDIIGKYLASEATAEERGQVEHWVNLSQDNRAYFKHFEIIFEKAASVKRLQEFDTDKAWINLKGRLAETKGRTVSFSSYWPALRIAAGIMIFLGLGYAAYQWLNVPIETIAIKAEGTIVRDSLPDGSKAVLNRGSSIAYSFNPRNNERKVTLEGEAFFDVKHDVEKPFIIESQDVIIEDVGTTFNVRAFPESETIEVFVETGEVAFYTIDNPGLMLIAGETGIYNKPTKTFARLQQIDTNKLAYRTGIFLFHNADLVTIIEDLNTVYDTQVRLDNDAIKDCKLNVSFRNESIDDIVEIIAQTLNLSLTKNGNEYVLSGVSCGG